MSKFSYELTATNLSETIEGAHSAVFGVMKELTQLEGQHQIVKSIKVVVETVDIEKSDSNEEKKMIKILSTPGISVTRTSNDIYEDINKYLEEQSNKTCNSIKGFMCMNEFCKFANKLGSLIMKIKGENIFDGMDHEECNCGEIIKLALARYNFPYSIKKESNPSAHYGFGYILYKVEVKNCMKDDSIIYENIKDALNDFILGCILCEKRFDLISTNEICNLYHDIGMIVMMKSKENRFPTNTTIDEQFSKINDTFNLYKLDYILEKLKTENFEGYLLMKK